MNKGIKLIIGVFVLISFGILFKGTAYADICGCTGDIYWCYSRDVCNAVTQNNCCVGGSGCMCDWFCGTPSPQMYGGEVYCCTYTEYDEDGCAAQCDPGCDPPTCSSRGYSSTNLNLGSLRLSCTDDCGDKEYRTCYCYDCMYNCPDPLSNTVTSFPPNPNLILSNFRNCTNDCAVSRTEPCYERPSAQPSETLDINEDDPNRYGFESESHSGRPGTQAGTLNDPITMTAKYIDANGADDIEALFVWFRNDTSTGEPNTPVWLSTTATPQALSDSSWGFMMRKTGPTSWVPYVPSYSPTTPVWTRALYLPNTSTFIISGPNRGNMVAVTVRQSDIGINSVEKSVTMKFSLYFSSSPLATITESVSQVKYKVLLMGLDRFSFTPSDNYSFSVANYWSINQLRYRLDPIPAQRYAKTWTEAGVWTIDRDRPTVSFSNLTPKIEGNRIRVEWLASDIVHNYSNLYAVVGNIYSSEGADARSITLLNPTSGVNIVQNTFIPLALTEDTTVGHLSNSVSFIANPNISTNTHTGGVTIDLGDNRSGSLIIYLTVFDDAGNMHSVYDTFDLNDWLVTDGGLAYSANGTSFVTKEIDPALGDNAWAGILPSYKNNVKVDWVESLTSSKGDLSTEMWAESNTALLKSGATRVDSYSILGHRGLKVNGFYRTYLKAYQEKAESVPHVVKGNVPLNRLQGALTNTCGNSNYCVILHTGPLFVNRNFTCGGRALIFVDGPLTIEPQLDNRNNKHNVDACIFIVSEEVIIKEGALADEEDDAFAYDRVNAYIVSDGNITIERESTSKKFYDGMYINGGLLSSSSIVVQRYLKLSDRLTYPAVAIDHHSKYGVLAGVFFGTNFTMQKVEVGFKPF